MARKSISTIVLAAVTLLLAGGCGGSGGGSNGGGGGGTVPGNYLGSLDMPNSNHGIVNLTVEAGGAGQGHLLVTGPESGVPSPQADGFPPGNYAIFGSVNDGSLDMQGVAGSTSFTVTGSLPEGDGNGTIVFHVEGSDFTGTIAKDNAPAAGGTITYSTVLGSNAHVADFPASEIFVSFDGGDGVLDVFFADETGTTHRSLGFNIPANVQAGDVITCSSSHHHLSYNENLPDVFEPNVWAADSGTITIEARTGNHITFTLNNVHMEHETSFGEGTGSFVLNGTIHS